MRLAALALLLIALCALGGFFYVGLHPPAPRTHTVDRMVPNDQFPTR